jgi:hypothetical protein
MEAPVPEIIDTTWYVLLFPSELKVEPDDDDDDGHNNLRLVV